MAATDSEPDSAAQAAGLSQDERAELERLRTEVTELRRKQADRSKTWPLSIWLGTPESRHRHWATRSSRQSGSGCVVTPERYAVATQAFRTMLGSMPIWRVSIRITMSQRPDAAGYVRAFGLPR